MRFIVDTDIGKIEGKLLYRTNEYSFDFIMVENEFTESGVTLMVKTLQIQVDINEGILLYPWGLHAYPIWQEGKLELPSYSQAGIRVLDLSVPQGTAKRIGSESEWKTIYDAESGWLCIHRDSKVSDYQYIEFATNVIIGLKEENVFSLWLKPEISDAIPKN